MSIEDPPVYPGTPQHQELQRAIVAHFDGDPRILAIALFGSLGRGNWDRYSDLDLDVVTVDDAELDPIAELTRLCQVLRGPGEGEALIIPDGSDAGDVLLGSLLQLSVRFHPLAATSPNIVESLRLLAGHIAMADIAAAGSANARPDRSAAQALDACIRHAAVVDVALQRGHMWDAIVAMHELRTGLMELYTLTHGGRRSVKFFQAEAPAGLQAQLAAGLPQTDLSVLRRSFAHCLDLLEHDLAQITAGRLRLTLAQGSILTVLRARQKTGGIPA